MVDRMPQPAPSAAAMSFAAEEMSDDPEMPDLVPVPDSSDEE